MKQILFVILLLVLANIPHFARAGQKCDYRGVVVALDDGDSFTMIIDKGKRKQQKTIRLMGIDAPEYKQDFSQAARKYLSRIIYKKPICVKAHTIDKHGRVVALVYAGDKNVNLAMLAAGYAWVFERFAHDLPWGLRKRFRAAQKNAKNNRLGLWQNPNAIPPWDFRDGRREYHNPTPNRRFSLPVFGRKNIRRQAEQNTGKCGTKRFCREMSSCSEARYYLNNCGLNRLDGDNDGVPCENLCRR